MKKYTDNMPPENQIDSEERIASILFDRFQIPEHTAQKISQEILLEILAEYRPDLAGNDF